MAKPKLFKNEKQVKTIEQVKAKCKDCKAEFTADQITFMDDSTELNPKHGRCPKCQTIHLTNLRVDKCMTAHKHIGNLKARLTKEQREAIIEALEQSFSEQVVSRLTGDVIVASGFDLAKV